MEQVAQILFVAYIEELGFKRIACLSESGLLTYQLGNIRLTVGSNSLWIFYKERLEVSLHGDTPNCIETIRLFMKRDQGRPNRGKEPAGIGQ